MKNSENTVKLILPIFIFILTFHIQVIGQNTSSPDNCLSPYFVVLGEEGSSEQLPLKATNVIVDIEGVIANVSVEQEYSNTGETPIEAIYIFPASTRAAVHNMLMQINDREIVAIVEEKTMARNMYETARSEGKTASLLEQQRPNVFQMNVANIVPGATVKVSLSYTELLIPNNNVYQFIYPTVVGPRYVSGKELESNVEWASNPYLKEGEAPPSAFKLNMNIHTGIDLKELRSTSHDVNIKYQSKSKASLSIKDSDGANRDFIAEYKLAGEQIETGVLLYEDKNGENYFLAMAQPPERPEIMDVPKKEYVFILDVSGSMNGFPLQISKGIMNAIFDKLSSNDKFNILLFAGGSDVYAKESVHATEENIANAKRYINNISGGGGTELISALQTALQLNNDHNYSRSFVILSDGYVSVEKEAFDLIRNNLNEANFFSFGIGSSVNRHLIEGLAHIGYGECFVATTQNEAKELSEKFIHYVSNPVLTNINLEFENIEAYDILPAQTPDLLASRPLIVSGKYRGRPGGKIKISGMQGKDVIHQEINLTQPETNTDALKYLWAREKVRLLSDYTTVSSNAELKTELISIGKKYNLLTEYTSFVAIDSEVSNSSGLSNTVKQPLPLPQGVSNLAIGNNGQRRLKSKAPSPQYNYVSTASGAADLEIVVFEEAEEASEMEIFVMVEDMPKFQGGNITNFQEFIQQNIKYPESALLEGIEGKVFVRFIINTKGEIDNIEIIRGLTNDINNEVIRVLKSSPLWTAGKQRGRPVSVTFAMPVIFKLN